MRTRSSLHAGALAAALVAVLAAPRGRADDGAPAAPQGGPPAGPPAPAPDGPAPDLVPPPPDLARVLARFDGEAEPGRELKRAFVAVVYYLLRGDVEHAVAYFHPDLRFDAGQGDLQPVPPARLREALAARAGEASGPRPPLEEVLDLDRVRAYSRARAREVDHLVEGFEADPAKIAQVMKDDDWLVMGRLKGGDFGHETFYVFRRDGARFKIVLAE
jgi:hypothetical protein